MLLDKYPDYIPNPDPKIRKDPRKLKLNPYWCNKHGKPYPIESICYILNEPEEIPADFWRDFTIDWDQMRKVLLKNRFQEIMHALGYEWLEVSAGQKKLMEFFK